MLDTNPMKWQDIIFTPLFWIISIIGSLVWSIVANLLTPYVSVFVTRRFHARRSGLRNKQIKRREKIITLQLNIARRTSTKLDAIFSPLLATGLLLTGIFLLQFVTTGDKSLKEPSTPILLIILFVLLAIMTIGKSAIDNMSLALTADRREAALHDFVKQRGNDALPDEVRQLEDEWDLRESGVTSKDLKDV